MSNSPLATEELISDDSFDELSSLDSLDGSSINSPPSDDQDYESSHQKNPSRFLSSTPFNLPSRHPTPSPPKTTITQLPDSISAKHAQCKDLEKLFFKWFNTQVSQHPILGSISDPKRHFKSSPQFCSVCEMQAEVLGRDSILVAESVLGNLDTVIGLRGEVNGWFEDERVGKWESRKSHRVWEKGLKRIRELLTPKPNAINECVPISSRVCEPLDISAEEVTAPRSGESMEISERSREETEDFQSPSPVHGHIPAKKNRRKRKRITKKKKPRNRRRRQ